jgi:hypothetical protein
MSLFILDRRTNPFCTAVPVSLSERAEETVDLRRRIDFNVSANPRTAVRLFGNVGPGKIWLANQGRLLNSNLGQAAIVVARGFFSDRTLAGR